MKIKKAILYAFACAIFVMAMMLGAYGLGIFLEIEEILAAPAALLAWGVTAIFLIALSGACLLSWRVLSRQGDQVELNEHNQLPVIREKVAGVLTYHNLAAFAAPSTIIQGNDQTHVTVEWAPRDLVPEGYRLLGRMPESVQVAEIAGLERLFRGNGGRS